MQFVQNMGFMLSLVKCIIPSCHGRHWPITCHLKRNDSRQLCYCFYVWNQLHWRKNLTWRDKVLVAINLNNPHCSNHEIIDYLLKFQQLVQQSSVSVCQINPLHLHHHLREKILHYLLKNQHLQKVQCPPAT